MMQLPKRVSDPTAVFAATRAAVAEARHLRPLSERGQLELREAQDEVRRAIARSRMARELRALGT